MNPNSTEKDDCNIRDSTNIPSHGSIPKWLEEITTTAVPNTAEPQVVDNMKIFQKFSMRKDTPRDDKQSNFGRRSSVTFELSKTLSKNIELTSSDYLVPKLDKHFDFGQFIAEEVPMSKSWKSLSDINKSRRVLIDPKMKDAKRLETDSEGSVVSLDLLSDYRRKMAAEERLRDHILRELISESRQILRADPEFSRKLYKSNSKYRDDSQGNDRRVFIIPSLPEGRTLVVEVLSTWGDRHYVGLNGIEVFDDRGRIAEVEDISASPSDINVLPECRNDPRVVSNLLDGTNRTRDDNHIWLTPFERESGNLITIVFKELTTVSMIRIWNYNKSRIHSYRGARDVVLYLDGRPIFKGEIAKASGAVQGGIHHFGDTILFTTDDEILENISRNDTSYSYLTSKPNTPQEVDDRPPTGMLRCEARPITGVSRAANSNQDQGEQILLGVNVVDVILLQNWGSKGAIGLTGFEVLQGDSPLKLNDNQVSCPLGEKDLWRIVNGKNLTMDPEDMWLVPFAGDEVRITVDLKGYKYLSGLNVWNYNGSLESSYAGAQTVKILLDGKPLINPNDGTDCYILRRAPGNEHYDYVQEINFCEPHRNRTFPISRSPTSIVGFVIQIVVYSTWGDKYYCGLNGIELYDEKRKIVLEEQNVCAYPESVNVLPNVTGDLRTSDKLIDNVNEDVSGVHSWLAPVIPKHLNRIYVVMDVPIAVSSVRMWNYSKDPSRGVKDFGILIDDLLICTGTLERSQKGLQGQLFELSDQDQDDKSVGQDVVLLNDSGKNESNLVDETLRPFTCMQLSSRSFTSYSN